MEDLFEKIINLIYRLLSNSFCVDTDLELIKYNKKKISVSSFFRKGVYLNIIINMNSKINTHYYAADYFH
jgi:hypothetical protein